MKFTANCGNQYHNPMTTRSSINTTISNL